MRLAPESSSRDESWWPTSRTARSRRAQPPRARCAWGLRTWRASAAVGPMPSRARLVDRRDPAASAIVPGALVTRAHQMIRVRTSSMPWPRARARSKPRSCARPSSADADRSTRTFVSHRTCASLRVHEARRPRDAGRHRPRAPVNDASPRVLTFQLVRMVNFIASAGADPRAAERHDFRHSAAPSQVPAVSWRTLRSLRLAVLPPCMRLIPDPRVSSADRDQSGELVTLLSRCALHHDQGHSTDTRPLDRCGSERRIQERVGLWRRGVCGCPTESSEPTDDHALFILALARAPPRHARAAQSLSVTAPAPGTSSPTTCARRQRHRHYLVVEQSTQSRPAARIPERHDPHGRHQRLSLPALPTVTPKRSQHDLDIAGGQARGQVDRAATGLPRDPRAGESPRQRQPRHRRPPAVLLNDETSWTISVSCGPGHHRPNTVPQPAR